MNFSSFYWLRSLCAWVSVLHVLGLTRPHPPVLSIYDEFVSASSLLMFLNVHHHFNVVIVGKWDEGVCHSAIFNCPQIGDIELKQVFFDPSLKTTVLDLCSKLFTMSSLPFSSLFKQYLFFKHPYSIQYPSENLIQLSLWRLNVSIPPIPTVCFLNLQYNFYNHWLYSWNDFCYLWLFS